MGSRLSDATHKEFGRASNDLLVPENILRLCIKSLEANIETSTVHQLIRHLTLQPNQSASVLENWPWRVRVYTLGHFSVEINGQPLVFTGKSQKKPLELLKALIAFGGQNVSKAKLAETLWPDADGDNGLHSVSITLNRLRKLIGHDVILQQQGQLSLSSQDCWFDLRSFEYYLTTAIEELSHNHLDEAWKLTEKAIQLYKGQFLATDPGAYWSLSVGERARQKLLRHINSICNHLYRNGRYEHAIECYTKGLEIDDLQEDFYFGLIYCHKQLGHKAAALSVYKSCEGLMLSFFGEPPSNTIRALIQK